MAAPTDHARENEELNQLVADCLSARHAGGEAAVEALLAARPALASDVRRRLEGLAQAGMLGAGTPDRVPERLGEFRVLERLGGGGMGVVYRAVQEPLGREVALKLLRPEQHWFPGARERFRREVEAVARLQHPGIVPVYTVGEADGVPYFAMQRVAGCTLAQVLLRAKRGALAELAGRDMLAAVAAEIGEPEPESLPALFEGTWIEACLRVHRAMAEALEHAHRAGVVHRDLKPSNVMLTLEGRVMLLDFGLSSVEGAPRLTRTGTAVGSVPYLPPEVLAEEHAHFGVRGDVYSLGVSMYEALALALPFDAPSVVAIARLIVEARPVPLRRINSAVSPEAATVCAVAMERDPARRYPSAEALAHDLTNVLARRPIAARQTPISLRARRWVQRRPGFAAAAALALLGLTLGPSVFAWQAAGAANALAAENARTLDMLEQALEAVRSSLVVLGGEDVRDVPHLARKQREVLERAVGLYEQISAGQSESGARSPAALRLSDLRAEALTVLADARSDLGLAAEAEAAFEELRLEAASRLAGDPAHAAARLSLGRAHLGLSRGALERGEAERAAALAQAGLDAISAAGASAEGAELGLALALSAAQARFRGGEPAAAIAALEDALEDADEAVAAHPGAEGLRSRRTQLQLALGGFRFQTGDGEAAERAYVAAAAELELLSETALDLVRTKDRLVRVHLDLGQLYRGEWRIEEALVELECAVELQEDLARAFPDAEHRQFELVNALQSLGITLDFVDARRDEGHAALARARALMESLLAARPDDVDRVSVMGMVLAGLGTLCLHQAAASESPEDASRHLDEALALYPEAVARYEEARALAPGDPELARALRRGRLGHADVLLAAGRWEEAAAQARPVAEIRPHDWIELRMLAGRLLQCAALADEGAPLVAEAFAALELSVGAGYADLADLDGAPLLAPVRDLPGFAALRERVASAPRAGPEE